jgi:hypothetical protein
MILNRSAVAPGHGFLGPETLHPVWRERKDVEAHLEKKETF